MRRLFTPFIAIFIASFAVFAQSVSAASGDVTSTPFTAPAAVSGQTLVSSFADSTGGTFQVYRSGQTLTMIRIKQDGSVDSTFGGSGTVSIGVPSQLASSGSMRAVGQTNPKTSTWWVAVSVSGGIEQITNSIDVALTAGSLTGTVAVNKSVAASSIVADCASVTAGSTKYQSTRLQSRRDGGIWLWVTCATVSNPVASQALIPLDKAGDKDSAASVVNSYASHGGDGNCAYTTLVSDPTSVAPAPELWIVRTEYTKTECTFSPTASEITALSALTVSNTGTITRTQLTTAKLLANAVRIDPGGRPVFLTTDVDDNSKVNISRLKTDGSLDTSVGTNGFLLLDTGPLPTGANHLFVSFAGLVTTENRVYFAIQLYDTEIRSYTNATTPRTHGFRMALAAPAIGWATTYGTGGIGQRHTTVLAEDSFGKGLIQVTGVTVDSIGRPLNFTFSDSAASYNVWSAIAGATGGGEGGTGLGGFTRDTGGAPSLGSGGKSTGGSGTTSGDVRIDSKVYTKLPSSTEVNTALLVLTAKQARTQEIVSTTKQTCVVIGRRLALVGTGTCSARIQNKSNRKTVRLLSTRVRTRTSSAGTTMIASDPILFSSKSSMISAKAFQQIRQIASNAKGAVGIVIVGHATSLPNNQANLPLSQKRAQAVHNYLAKFKVTVPISKVAKGSSEPASTKKTLAGYAKNRRAVVYIIPSS
jgi:outer membrane protein OmpA-like peptidoglycan-associated protein